MSLGIDEGTVGVDALAMSLEIVQTGETPLARRVRALVRLGSERVVRLGVGLRVSVGQLMQAIDNTPSS